MTARTPIRNSRDCNVGAGRRPKIGSSERFDALCKRWFGERRLQGTEPRFEISPLLNGISIDRAPHLFGARGRDSAIGFPEVQTPFLEWKTAIIQHAADFIFSILYQMFVLHKMDPARHDRLPMLHQADIHVVVPPQVTQVVGKIRVSW